MRNSPPEIRANSAEIRRVQRAILADPRRFEVILDMRLVAMNEMLEFTHRELLAEIKFADKEDKAT
jgi:hypothetical protein